MKTKNLGPVLLLAAGLGSAGYLLSRRGGEDEGNGDDGNDDGNGGIIPPPPPPLEPGMSLQDLQIRPTMALPGQQVTIQVMALNTGEVDIGPHNSLWVELAINGAVLDSQEVQVAIGYMMPVSFSIIAPNEEGVYEVEVDGLRGSFSVVSVPTFTHYIRCWRNSSHPSETQGTCRLYLTNAGSAPASFLLQWYEYGRKIKADATGTLQPGEEVTYDWGITLGIGGVQVYLNGECLNCPEPPSHEPPPWMR